MNKKTVMCINCKGHGYKTEYDALQDNKCQYCQGLGCVDIKITESKELDDPIKPSHYHTGNIDVIKFGEENFDEVELKGFYRMNVIKYVTRYDKKNGLEDLEKATFYLDKLKELERGKHERG